MVVWHIVACVLLTGVVGSLAAAQPIERHALLGAARNSWKSGQTQQALAQYREILRRFPNDDEARGELAWSLIQVHREDEAIVEYRYLLIGQPRNVAYQRSLVGLLVQLQRYPEAEQQLREFLAFDPGQLEFRRQLADIYTWTKRYAQAIARYRELLATRPDDLALLKAMGNAQYWSQDYRAAAETYQRVLAQDSADLDVWSGYLHCLRANGKTDDLFREVRRYLKINPKDVEFQIALVDLYLGQSKFADAENQMRGALRAAGNQPALVRRLADGLAGQGKFAQAIPLYRDLLAKQPKDSELRMAYLNSLAGAGQPQAVIEEAEAYVRARPDDVVAGQLLADAYRATNRPDKALDALLGLPSEVRERAETQADLANLYFLTGRSEDAVPLYREILARRPDDRLSKRRLAQSLAQTRQYAEALTLYRELGAPATGDEAVDEEYLRALRVAGAPSDFVAPAKEFLTRYPQNGVIRRLLAEADLEQKDFADAEQQLAALSQGQVEGADLQMLKARTFVGLQKFDAALPLYVEALGRDSTNEGLRREYAGALASARKFPEAIEQYELLVKSNPREAQYVWEMSQAQGANRDVPAQIRSLVSFLELKPGDAGARVQLAELYVAAQQYDPAVEQYELLVRRDPAERAHRSRIARLYAWKHDYPRAEAAFRQLRGEGPLAADEMGDLADVYVATKDYPQALVVLDQLLSVRPEDKALWRRKADVLQWSGNLPASSEAFRVLLAADPGDLDARLQLAQNLQSQRLWSESYEHYSQVVAKDPTNFRARVGQAQCLMAESRLAEAAAVYESLTRDFPKRVDGYVGLAEVRAYQGDLYRAQKLYQQALAVDDQQPQARRELEQIRRQRAPVLSGGASVLEDTNSVQRQNRERFTFPVARGILFLENTISRFAQNDSSLLRESRSVGVQEFVVNPRFRLWGSYRLNSYSNDTLSQSFLAAFRDRPTEKFSWAMNVEHTDLVDSDDVFTGLGYSPVASLAAVAARVRTTRASLDLAYDLATRRQLLISYTRGAVSDGNGLDAMYAHYSARSLASERVQLTLRPNFYYMSRVFTTPLYFSPQHFVSPGLAVLLESGRTGRVDWRIEDTASYAYLDGAHGVGNHLFGSLRVGVYSRLDLHVRGTVFVQTANTYHSGNLVLELRYRF